MFYSAMTDRPASWRMPSRKEMEKMASTVGRRVPPASALAPGDDLPPEYWQALLKDARTDARSPTPSSASLRLAEITQHLLRVSCRRCGRTVEIQKVDAVRLYGERASWKEVGLRLLDDTCTQRTGRHEEDGCWPSY
jgi:hypothetical protein